jgi:hypothetical protein
MRLSFVHLLAALLIAVFAIGAPPPAQAECAKCVDCGAEAPARNDAPCPEKGLACQIATSCASQLQKMPAHAVIASDLSSGKAVFGDIDDIAVKLAFIKPETSPPRF